MNKILGLLLALTLCFGFGSIITYATESNGSSPNNENVPTVISEELQAKEDEALTKYNNLFQHWAYNPEIIDDVYADFPHFFAGAYIDADKNLMIQVTTLDNDIVNYFSEIIDLSNVVFEEVKYSYSELLAEKDAISNKLDSTRNSVEVSSISGVGISFEKNSVNLYVYLPEMKSYSEELIEEVKSTVSTFENINTMIESGPGSTFATTQRREAK